MKPSNPEEMSALEILRAAGYQPDKEQMAKLSPEEILWWTGVMAATSVLVRVLDELSPDDIVDLWRKKTKRPRKKGKRFDRERIMAHFGIQMLEMSPDEAFDKIYLPFLISEKRIGIEMPSGIPNPQQEQDARDNFFKSLDRLKKKPQ